MSEQPLKPCPFCGSVTAPIPVRIAPTMVTVRCKPNMGGCDSESGVATTEYEAIAAWNKRADQSKELAALRAFAKAVMDWTHPVQKDVFPPKGDGSVSGWVFNSGSWSRQASVKMTWSESCAHGDGERRKEFFSASQLGIAMYSSELLAWKAARHAVERESADKLRHIDREIARLESSAS